MKAIDIIRRESVEKNVFTDMKTRSAFLMASSMSVEKKRLTPRHEATTSWSPG